MGAIVEPVTATANPFDSVLAREHSNYCFFDGRRLSRAEDEPSPSNMTAFVHDSFRALTLNEHFTCVGAKAAIRQGGYRFGLYDALGSPPSSAGLARDLFTFSRERASFDAEFSTFVACFASPPTDEVTFEGQLWSTLQQLNDLDAGHHEWNREVAADASDPQFSFSFAGTAFFIVGLHAASSRTTRRFAWPTLIFNPHDQFDELKRAKRYGRFQEVIRGAERALQGDINPMLTTFGERSEASQYSGREVDSSWKCPFHSNAEGGDAGKNPK